jgi:hypothetical protein
MSTAYHLEADAGAATRPPRRERSGLSPVPDAAVAQQIAALLGPVAEWSGAQARVLGAPMSTGRDGSRVGTPAGSTPDASTPRGVEWGPHPGHITAPRPAVEVCTPRAASHLASQLRAGSEGVRDLHGASEGGTALRSDPQVLLSAEPVRRVVVAS